MAASATEWAWRQSRAKNGSLIVLLAIADEQDKGNAEMTVMDIARKARLSERAAQNALRDLAALGELSVSGSGGRRRYAGRGAESAPPQNLHPAESAPQPEVIHTPETTPGEPKPQASTKWGADSAPPGPVDNFSDDFDLGSVVSGRRSRSRATSSLRDDCARPCDSAPLREDAERLCQHLADRIEANGSKRPNIGKRWRDSARLLIDNDGRTEENIHRAIDWSQQDDFWHRNILSMPALRKHYDRLQLDAKAEQQRKSRPSGKGNPDDDYAAALQRIQARKEHANGTRGDGDNRPARQVSLPPAAD